ncbi:hypothetical protein Taro_036376 [Colocasia esculenta]|uniref:Uncharacterized protein n=1 Tax=Colocasia esculenta TaxID=4460 RepID=A0A843WLH4_COLES|nr:hypothetical protein [Colocasia esculenta]
MRPARDARNDLIDTLCAQLAGTEVQLGEAREVLDALALVERTDITGTSSSRCIPDPEMASLRAQLAAVTARAEETARDLSAQSDELQSALSREASARAEVTELSQRLSELQTQVTPQDADLPRDAMELRMTLSLERRDRERERARLTEERREERRQWSKEREWLSQ